MVIMKFNPLLNCFPEEYRGVPINTDFRIGIELSLLFNRNDVSDNEKKYKALVLLYGYNFDKLGVDVLKLWEGVEWFMNVGYNKCTNRVEDDSDEVKLVDSEGEKLIFDTEYKADDDIIDFEFDAYRIYTAFLRTYGVDLTEANIHFFKFIFMLSDLDNDCSHSKVVEIRQANLNEMEGKQRKAYIKMKRIYAIPTELDEQAKAKLADVGLDESDLEQFMQF